MVGEGGDGEKKGIDELLSKEAVRIDGNLDQIFEDSEEEEEGPQVGPLRGFLNLILNLPLPLFLVHAIHSQYQGQ